MNTFITVAAALLLVFVLLWLFAWAVLSCIGGAMPPPRDWSAEDWRNERNPPRGPHAGNGGPMPPET